MIWNAAQLCELLEGELEGDGDQQIYGPSQIDAGVPGTVTFLANPKYEDYAYTTEASVVIVSKDFTPKKSLKASLIRVHDVRSSMMQLLQQFGQNGVPDPGISAQAVISEQADLNADVTVGAYAVIEKDVKVGKGTVVYSHVYIGHGVVIGENCMIYPGVRIYPNTIIGHRCILHANAVVGCDGFGYKQDEQGAYTKVPHVGNVILEDDVEIGANSVIDRGTIAVTKIGQGSKIDNLVQIAHNVVIGKHTVIAAQAGIAGSASVGDNARIGGQVGIAGHIHIADRIEIQAQSGVHTGKYPEGSKIFGYPAIPYQEYLKSYAVFKQLPGLMKKLAELEKEIHLLKKSKS